jgi:tRNA modification GTPase
VDITNAEVGAAKKIKKSLSVSATTGAGIDALLKQLAEKTTALFSSRRGQPSLTRARHRQALEQARSALERSLEARLPELAAEDLRLALRHLGALTGKVHVEDLLDVIFKDFCIGK